MQRYSIIHPGVTQSPIENMNSFGSIYMMLSTQLRELFDEWPAATVVDFHQFLHPAQYDHYIRTLRVLATDVTEIGPTVVREASTTHKLTAVAHSWTGGSIALNLTVDLCQEPLLGIRVPCSITNSLLENILLHNSVSLIKEGVNSTGDRLTILKNVQDPDLVLFGVCHEFEDVRRIKDTDGSITKRISHISHDPTKTGIYQVRTGNTEQLLRHFVLCP
ncbi:hypothetical protein CcaverHIS002_0412010 [Cutaneotrichosporon cavernicola]|nr:hypothetical protein CcaverHIS002_0412010 [Cutaneotrichosporon cavernicola]BEJ00142.1 hypothetical protein CcaverHIS631_0411840 [Cutaneotrichosporon cavernicola]BEJ07914.1 hypothetical protein CcaverHIS641_0411830 [Cutaneotrichosporon cavernicola]